MTRDEIEGLSGRALDAAVSLHVFGFKLRQVLARDTGKPVTIQDDDEQFADGTHTEHGLKRFASAPPYSTDIAAAWDVVEKVQGGGEVLTLSYRCGDREPFDKLGWFACFRHANAWAADDSAAVAICRAALLLTAG